MATIDLNFSGVKGFEPLEEGTYTLVVNKVTYNSQAGKEGKFPYFNFEFGVLPQEEHGNRKVFEIRSMHPDALWSVKAMLEALTGAPWEDDGMALDPDDLVGLTCKAVLFIDEYKGKLQNKIQSVMPADDDSPKPENRRAL